MAEWRNEVATGRMRAEVIEGQHGDHSPSHLAALVSLDKAGSKLAEAEAAVAAAIREIVTSMPGGSGAEIASAYRVNKHYCRASSTSVLATSEARSTSR